MSSSHANLEKYRIPLEEILRVTRNFSSETLIGDGGFGMVHIGQLSEEWQRLVAIKRLNRDGYQGSNEYNNELEMVSSFHHPNIITFIGFCDEANEMIIVSDYAKNGSLDHHLQNPDKRRCMTWAQRLKICLGAAKGLNYLHSGLGDHNRVIHRDVKSANILLDENLEAKICDFGLSRFGARNEDHTQLLTKAAGTRYYMDPLYVERSRLTKESDIYSFGVVMFEMSSGTLVYHEKCFGDDDDAKRQYLIDVVRSCYDDCKNAAKPDALMDPMLRDDIDMKSFHTFNKIAHECLNLKIEQRPTLGKIIRKIEQALKIHLNHHRSPSTVTTRSLDSFLIPIRDINLATQNFKSTTCIRHYENSAVYKGQLYRRWQNRTMAITRLYPKRYQRGDEFKKELQMISNLHHQNMSPFIGYCYDANEIFIVHEYGVNGELANYLGYGKKRDLTWPERLKIILGAARGLQYIHSALGEDLEATCGHIKSGNILLDENMEAKVSFFNFAEQKVHGYRYKSGMYSFVVIMLEMLSGERFHTLDRYVSPEYQIGLFQEYYHNNELDQFIDGYIRDQIDSHSLKILKNIAYQGTLGANQRRGRGGPPIGDKDMPTRFTMDEVVDRIENIVDF